MIDPERIWSSDSLPTLPAVASRLLELQRHPDTSIADVIGAIRTDPAIAARLLRASNSAYFGFRSQITSIERAVPLLGTNVVTSLALSFSLVEDMGGKGPLRQHFEDYWRQSVVQACAAEVLGERLELDRSGDCFLAGLLMDIGRLAMLKTVRDEYVAVLDAARESRRPLQEAEREVLGIDHVVVGIRLMESWSLPDELVAAVRTHHADVLPPSDGSEQHQFVRVANVASAVGEYFCSTNNGPSLERLRQVTTGELRMSAANLDTYLGELRTRIGRAAELFSVDVVTLPSPSDMLCRANQHLAEIAFRAQAAIVRAESQRNELAGANRRLEEQNRELQHRSVRDPLTNSFNRRFFEEALANEVERCSRSAAPVAVVFSDIDRFKLINDTHGHPFGDTVLVAVARAFDAVLRRSDVVARYGGEEFVALVLNPTEKALATVADRLRTRVESLSLRHDGEHVPVTISIGAAWTVPGKFSQGLCERLVASADEAMYEAKRAGRNQVRVACLLDEFERRLARLVTGARFSRWLVSEGVLEIPTLSRVLMSFRPQRVSLGEWALRFEALEEADVARILEEQRARPECRFGELAHDLGLLGVEQIGWLLAQQQEPCDALAAALVEHSLLAPDRAAELRERYLAGGSFAGHSLLCHTP